MPVVVAARTSVGTVRKQNQDAFVVGDTAFCLTENIAYTFEASLEFPLLLAVADGIGGYAAGERASAMLVRRLAEERPRSPEALGAVLRDVHRTLKEIGVTPEILGLGTTFCGMLLSADGAGTCVGDGFVAVLAGRALRPLAMSWESVESGSEIDAAIGGGVASDDVLSPVWFNVSAVAGARYVVATDGLIRALPYEQCRMLLAAGVPPAETIERIFEAALHRGAPDNITCIIADMKGS